MPLIGNTRTGSTRKSHMLLIRTTLNPAHPISHRTPTLSIINAWLCNPSTSPFP